MQDLKRALIARDHNSPLGHRRMGTMLETEWTIFSGHKMVKAAYRTNVEDVEAEDDVPNPHMQVCVRELSSLVEI